MSATWQRANQRSTEVRRARSAARRELKALPVKEARARLARLLIDCPGWLRTVPLHVAVCWLPQVRAHRGDELLARINAPGYRHVGNLTMRQRMIIARALGHRETE